MSRPVPLRERFERWRGRGKPDACWLWTGCTFRSGYGMFWTPAGNRLAHRAAWEFENGPVPVGLYVLHSCNNRLCTNPAHLRPGTAADNSADTIAAGHQVRGERKRGARLTGVDVSEIRRRIHTESAASIARRLGVHATTVSRAARGSNWAHVSEPLAAPSARGHRHYRAKLTPEQVALVRREVARGARQAPLAALLGVSPSTVSRVALGQAYRNVTEGRE